MSHRVLTPDDVGIALAAAGWVAVGAFRWRDTDGAVLGWPLALAAVQRRARAGAEYVVNDGGVL